MMHTIYPLDQVWAGYDKIEPLEEMQVHGCLVQVQRIDARQVQLVRLISPNPQDYLRAELAPGNVLRM